jgi:hypothetical protein
LTAAQIAEIAKRERARHHPGMRLVEARLVAAVKIRAPRVRYCADSD